MLLTVIVVKYGFDDVYIYMGERKMTDIENLDLSFEEIELNEPQMDISDVQAGCWGDSGSDYGNCC